MPVMDRLTVPNLIKCSCPDVWMIAYTALGEPQLEVTVQSVLLDKFGHKDPKTEAIVDLFSQPRRLHQWQKYLEEGSPGTFHLQNQGYMDELKNGRY